MENYSSIKDYISEREAAIYKEIDKKLDNPFLNAYYNGVLIELKALSVVIDASSERDKVLQQLSKCNTTSL